MLLLVTADQGWPPLVLRPGALCITPGSASTIGSRADTISSRIVRREAAMTRRSADADRERAWRAAHVPASKEYRAAHPSEADKKHRGPNPPADLPAAAPGGPSAKFRGLGVRVRNGMVCKNQWPGDELGPLAGACAEITDGTRVHNVAAATLTLMPVIALSKRTKGARAFVIFPDGKIHEHKLTDRKMITAAKADAIRFNALAAAQRP
jgi:hypothetical protein